LENGRVLLKKTRMKFFFNNKNLHLLELAKKLSRQALKTPMDKTHLMTTITDEEDEEEYLNSTQNPLDDTELSVLITTIMDNTENDTWINSKSTMAAKI
jgi:light-regulated signal transduction histidine kinase (bacteriophytochrome)